MSAEEVKRFALDVKEDETLMEGIKQAGTSMTDIAEYAKSKGYDFGSDTLQSMVEERMGELNYEELDKVSAGAPNNVNIGDAVVRLIVEILSVL